MIYWDRARMYRRELQLKLLFSMVKLMQMIRLYVAVADDADVADASRASDRCSHATAHSSRPRILWA